MAHPTFVPLEIGVCVAESRQTFGDPVLVCVSWGVNLIFVGDAKQVVHLRCFFLSVCGCMCELADGSAVGA